MMEHSLGLPESELRAALHLSPSLVSDPLALEQVLARLKGKYLPAALRAASQQAEDRAWLSLHHYLTFRVSPRKPFQLTPSEADRVIGALYEMVRRVKDQG